MAVDYCTEAQVTANLKGVSFSATTAVTTAALADFITEESSIIDAHIQTKYTLPIADASALVFLRRICLSLVVYRVTKVLQAKNALPAPDEKVVQEISHSSAYSDAMRMLRAIADGKMQIPEEEKKSINRFSSTAVDNDESYVLEHDTTQW